MLEPSAAGGKGRTNKPEQTCASPKKKRKIVKKIANSFDEFGRGDYIMVECEYCPVLGFFYKKKRDNFVTL